MDLKYCTSTGTLFADLRKKDEDGAGFSGGEGGGGESIMQNLPSS